MDFRNHAHRSLKTGTMAPIHHTPWLHALDDSMACYLNKVEGPIDPNLLKANEYIKVQILSLPSCVCSICTFSAQWPGF